MLDKWLGIERVPPAPLEIDHRGIDIEVAKQFLAQVSARLEAQMKSIDNLRARLMDVARMSTTLATASVGYGLSGLSTAPAVASAAYLAAAIWTCAGMLSVVMYRPVPWGLPGWPPHEWVTSQAALTGPKAETIILALGFNRWQDCAQNAAIMLRAAGALRVSIGAMVLAPAVAGASLIFKIWG